MAELAVRVENLSKQYRIAATTRDQGWSRHSVRSAVRSLVWSRNGRQRLQQREFWALRDVSFEIKQGEIVGIIGRNGAGKSTLLKILSRITEPTSGRGELYGRVGSLLEVGTGFDPELTGRENVYLSGVILGMKKTEIDRRFDEIVAFAEVDRFIDTPIKRYSSGMRVRLAFAVAAHLEPEIVLLDEVLAVGDGRFQKKCLNKMDDVGQQGRTILFVSHNMPSVSRLCPRTLLFEEGRLVEDGPSSPVISRYLSSGEGTTTVRSWPDPSMAPGGEFVRLRGVRVRGSDGETTEAVDIRCPVGVDVEYEVLMSGIVPLVNIELYNDDGVYLFSAQDTDSEWRQRPRAVGRYISTAWIPGNFLSEGRLFIHVGLSRLNPLTYQHYEQNAVTFHVVDTLDGDSARGDYHGSMGGVVRPLLKWTTRAVHHEPI